MMHIKQLDFVLDCITDEEMRSFETKNMSFSHSNITGENNSHKITKTFRFHTKKEFDIVFFLEAAREWENEFAVRFDFNPFIQEYWAEGIEKILLPEYLKDIKPVLSFFEQKKEEIRKVIQKNKIIRFIQTVEDIEINVYNDTFTWCKEIEDFEHSPNFITDQKKIKKRLKKLGVVLP